MSSPAQMLPQHPRFPHSEFFSMGEFQNYYRESRPEIDANYSHERSLASASPWVHMQGTCAPCLRPATFSSATAGGEFVADGMHVPNWREELRCDCADHLNARYRATLHYLQSIVGFTSHTRLLWFGSPNLLEDALRRRIHDVASLQRISLRDDGYALDLPSQSRQIIVSMDVLHHVPPINAALAEFRRVLLPGGHLIFTVPFYIFSGDTTSRLDDLVPGGGVLPTDSAQSVHQIGWDILERLRQNGFSSSSVVLYRSEELGYLGLLNVLIVGIA